MSEQATTEGEQTRSWRRRLAERWAPRMRVVHLVSMLVAAALAIGTLVTLQDVFATQERVGAMEDEYQLCRGAVDNLQEASDFLTTEARAYVDTGDRMYLDSYISEITRLDRRGGALEVLRENADGTDALEALTDARAYSDSLSLIELYAERLVAEANDMDDMPVELMDVELEADDAALGEVGMRVRAHDLLYGDDYDELKMLIRESVQECSSLLLGTLEAQMQQSNAELDGLVRNMRVMVVLLLGVVGVTVLSTQLFLIGPMAVHAGSIRRDEPLEIIGAAELRALTTEYNEMYARNQDSASILDFEAHNDALTGMLNRGAFDSLLNQHRDDCALVLVDVDEFKQFNDTWGHEMGDAILVEVSATLFSFFRVSDYVCRIGGDEFAVIMCGADASARGVIAEKLEGVAEFLRQEDNGLPPATVSVGVAFGGAGVTAEELFCRADAALYEAKRRGRDGYVFDGETG